jgi:hypothetical protein
MSGDSASMSSGFRRRILISPVPGRVTVELEDDYHRMSVIVAHEAGIASTVGCAMPRAPWTTCPGAGAMLAQAFAGRPLADFPTLGKKAENCTHLYDLALFAAAHAHETEPTLLDIIVSDPVDGIRRAELRRNGALALEWEIEQHRIVKPAAIAGTHLRELNGWIASLDSAGREAARALRWASMIAHGRDLPLAGHGDSSLLGQATCYTAHPSRKGSAVRIMESIRDFPIGGPQPLSEFIAPNGVPIFEKRRDRAAKEAA